MAVYVDDMNAKFGRMVMAHMIADSDAELRDMATRIGVAQKWHQGDHFDICLSKKALAISAGAIPITYRQAGAMHARRRATGSLGSPHDALQWSRDRRAARRVDSSAAASAPKEPSMDIRIVGPRDRHGLGADWALVNTTSRSTAEWSTDLSPFFLGPCPLYGGRTAMVMENAWQFAKVYPEQLDAHGNPSPAYWQWAEQGWARRDPVRYPRGKGAKPSYLWWNGQKLGYVEGRLKVYWALYRDAVATTGGFRQLQAMVAEGRKLALFDFDGYDHDAAGVPLSDVLRDKSRPMGHAFVLKAMLIHGSGVSPEQVFETPQEPGPAPRQPTKPQLSLF